MDFLALKEWSPYLVGILIGLLNLGALLVSKKPSMPRKRNKTTIGGTGTARELWPVSFKRRNRNRC